MSALISFEKCLAFLNWQWNAASRRPAPTPRGPRMVLTFSRQAGSGAHTIAEQLVARLQAQTPRDAPPWTVFDRNLVQQVLQDHHLPLRLVQHMPEDRASQVDDIIDDLFEMKPPSWKLVEQTSETILRLATLGHVILIGRGANIVTASLPNVFHVRLIAPFEQRVAHIRELLGLSPTEAAKHVRGEDRGRARYLKRYFRADIEDPSLYHLVLNTGLVSYDEATDILFQAVTRPVAAG